jgi:hypothetical protein
MLESLVESAFEYAYPLFAVAHTRFRAVQDPGNTQRHPPNTVRHERHLSDHHSRWITAPNNDTLYSNAWLDLSHGPVQVRVATLPAGRYWSVAFMDAFTNHIAMLGQRLDGIGPADVTLVGPGQHDASLPGRVIRAPGNDVWLFGRWLVDGAEDLSYAYAMQRQLEVLAPASTGQALRVAPGAATDARNFLAVVNESLAHNPPPAHESELWRCWEIIGLRPGAVDAWSTVSEDARTAWTINIVAAFERLRIAGASGRTNIHGWVASGPEIGNFGANFALRASVALGGLGALEPVEARYFVKFHDQAMHGLDGRNRYVLRVPPAGIPTDSFWSFSMYAPTADGKRVFVENPIRRYSIGNRTPGLVSNADGSLDISLQHKAPGDPRRLANWLPTPAGPFQISLRAYLPSQALLDGSVEMPTVIFIDGP